MKIKSTLKVGILGAILCFSGLIYAQTPTQIADFRKAAVFDDLSEVKSLISQGVSPNTKDPKGNPMLIVAIKDKSYKVVDYLLNNKDIDVNLTNNAEESPLMIASIEGDLPVVKQLVINKKAEINPKGWTPLHYACTRGNLDVAAFLLANGAQVNALSPNHTTPLMMAVSSGNEQVVKLLLDNGADLKIRNIYGMSAIDVAEKFSKDGIRDGLMSRWQKLYKQPYPGGPKAISS